MAENADAGNATGRMWSLIFKVLCGLIFVFLLGPLVAVIPLSFNSVPYFSYPMQGFSLRWYQELFGSSNLSLAWQKALWNSLTIGISSTFIGTLLGTPAALGIYRLTGTVRSLVFALVLSPIVVPIIVVGLGMFYFFARLGLNGTMLGIILAHAALGAPFVVITVMASLANYDPNLTRAGAILGANPLRVFRKITLPIILPGVVSGAVFAFVSSWDEIVVVLFMASPEQHTIPRRMWSGIREQISPSIIAAATLLILFSIAVLFVIEWLNSRTTRMIGEVAPQR